MFKELNSLFIEKGITIIGNKINIINYTKIDYFSLDKIKITMNEKKVVIKGEKLTLEKLLNDELEIKGVIKIIEFR